VQETDVSTEFTADAGSGDAWTVHVEPFQLSTNVAVTELPPSFTGYALPTAVHASAPEHDTESNRESVAPDGDGAAFMLQAAPFHDSTNGRITSRPFEVSPTAMHSSDETQETAVSVFGWSPGGLGVVWMAHAAPLQSSAKVTSAPVLLDDEPTATQFVAAMHVTPARLDPVAPVGIGVDCRVHATPFHVCVIASTTPPALVSLPVAMQAFAAVQKTPSKVALDAPGLAVFSMAQAAPFHVSERPCSTPAALVEEPTATHAVVLAHFTPSRELADAPAGLGLVSIDQVLPFKRSTSVSVGSPLIV
jgi:hypothetical protein